MQWNLNAAHGSLRSDMILIRSKRKSETNHYCIVEQASHAKNSLESCKNMDYNHVWKLEYHEIIILLPLQ